jgi:UDP-N-acetylglucosamine--N-acetylmuramyl-(pentapeptide) pyrophosphoryl-undecaprenol N-acetylglucosamine transferase
LRLLVSGGASGGHISAALAVASAFKAAHPAGDVLLVGQTGGPEERLVREAGFPLATIHVHGWNRDDRLENVQLTWVLPGATIAGLRLVASFKPDVVLGVGAYAMCPCIGAARVRRIPFVLQVSEPGGLANRLFRSSAAAACVSFEADVERFRTRRTVYTGYPIRYGFVRGTPAAPPTRLLVMGGGMGARRINQTVWACLDALLERFETVVHLTGAQGEREAATLARPPRYQPIPWVSDLGPLLQQADLVLCRAGVGTCAELLATGVPAVLVPGQFGGRHQEHNSGLLASAGAARVIPDAELTPRRLLQELEGLTPATLCAMADATRRLGRTDGAQQIVKVLDEVAAQRPRAN